ncbi:MAG: N-acetylglucosamine kinase [Flavobacteriales bacterium]|nr:N-acetylglucosamine kinase [Flavobacteriales bacterium]
MILIADSGSSKTDWALVDQNGLVQLIETVGLNPDFHSDESILKEVGSVAAHLDSIPKEVQFYGSGASSESRKLPIKNALERTFKDAKVHVAHDLLGAARATLGNQKGLVGILGTGSNCSAYDGNRITKEFRSGGYILSDEGGGVYMGKQLLKAFIEDQLEDALKQNFTTEFDLDVDKILQKIYKESMPNRFIASFSEFIYRHQANPQIQGIIEANFNAFFEEKVCRFDDHQNLPLGVVGSIANHFKSHLESAAKKYNCNLEVVVSKPIDALVSFHQAKLG